MSLFWQDHERDMKTNSKYRRSYKRAKKLLKLQSVLYKLYPKRGEKL